MTLIKVAVTFNSFTKRKESLVLSDIKKYFPDERQKKQALEVFRRYGFSLDSESEFTMTVKGQKKGYEELFGTELFEIKLKNASEPSIWYPKTNGKWNFDHELRDVIDDAYIQWPHYYSQNVTFAFPNLSYYHLKPPDDLIRVLNVKKVHEQNINGKGINVMIIDSGFQRDHSYFEKKNYKIKTILGPGASNENIDEHGHGTVMVTNLLSIAPKVNLTCMKLANHEKQGKSAKLNQAFEKILKMDNKPKIISLSLTYDLTRRGRRVHSRRLPKGNRVLEGLILKAIEEGITIICAAGNGHVGFPAMMKEVVSVGGVYVDQDNKMLASDFTSAFTSKIYPNRKVPDFCGLSGLKNNDDPNNPNPVPGGLIVVPVKEGCNLDMDKRDNSTGNDGWSVEGGSSSATAQVAGVCALILQKKSELTPSQVKQVLSETSRNVKEGKTNERSNERHILKATMAQPDDAVGYGLIDAFAAVNAL